MVRAANVFFTQISTRKVNRPPPAEPARRRHPFVPLICRTISSITRCHFENIQFGSSRVHNANRFLRQDEMSTHSERLPSPSWRTGPLHIYWETSFGGISSQTDVDRFRPSGEVLLSRMLGARLRLRIFTRLVKTQVGFNDRGLVARAAIILHHKHELSAFCVPRCTLWKPTCPFFGKRNLETHILIWITPREHDHGRSIQRMDMTLPPVAGNHLATVLTRGCGSCIALISEIDGSFAKSSDLETQAPDFIFRETPRRSDSVEFQTWSSAVSSLQIQTNNVSKHSVSVECSWFREYKSNLRCLLFGFCHVDRHLVRASIERTRVAADRTQWDVQTKWCLQILKHRLGVIL